MKAHPDAITHRTFNLVGNKSKQIIVESGYLVYARLSSTSGDLVATLYTDAPKGSTLQNLLTRLSTTADSLMSERNPDAPDIPCPEGILVSTTATSDTQEALLEISYVNRADYVAAYPEVIAKNAHEWNESPGRDGTEFAYGFRAQTAGNLWLEGDITDKVRTVETGGNSVGYRVAESTHTRVTT